jgi:molecular chaperone GrpE
VNRDADDPEAEQLGDDAPVGQEGEADGQVNLPIDALLDWGTDPAKLDDKLERELGAQSAEALLAAERDEYLDALRRLQADFDNFRKRSLRQQTELLERATEGLCMRLLPVLDALDLATAHLRNQAETNDAAKALEQIDSLLRDILAHEGIEKIDAVDVPFDPTVHDAVGHVPAEAPPGPDAQSAPDAPAVPEAGAAEPGDATKEAKAASKHGAKPVPRTTKAPAQPVGPVVAQVMRPGYRMRSKVLRPAMVLVGD